MADIDLRNLSDRELLLLVVQEQRNTNTHLGKLNGSVGEHNTRIIGLEKWQSWLMGGMGVLGLLVVPVAIKMLVV